jgi:hypothetical protein
MKSIFLIKSKSNLELILTNLDGIWENQRDDGAHNNMEDIKMAEQELTLAHTNWNGSLEIHTQSFSNFGGDFVEAAIENAMEEEAWEDA